REGMPHELGRHRARARPGLHDPLLVLRVHRPHLLLERLLNERAFLDASCHDQTLWLSHHWVALPRLRPRTISRCDAFFVLRVFVPSFLPHGLTTLRPPRVRPPCGW